MYLQSAFTLQCHRSKLCGECKVQFRSYTAKRCCKDTVLTALLVTKQLQAYLQQELFLLTSANTRPAAVQALAIHRGTSSPALAEECPLWWLHISRRDGGASGRRGNPHRNRMGASC